MITDDIIVNSIESDNNYTHEIYYIAKEDIYRANFNEEIRIGYDSDDEDEDEDIY